MLSHVFVCLSVSLPGALLSTKTHALLNTQIRHLLPLNNQYFACKQGYPE